MAQFFRRFRFVLGGTVEVPVPDVSMRKNPHFGFSRPRDGVVTATVTGLPTPESVTGFFDVLVALSAVERIGIIVDVSAMTQRTGLRTSNSTRSGAQAILSIPRLSRANRTRGVVAAAVVIQSVEVRGITGVIIAAAQPLFRARIVSTLEDARLFIDAQVDKAIDADAGLAA